MIARSVSCEVYLVKRMWILVFGGSFLYSAFCFTLHASLNLLLMFCVLLVPAGCIGNRQLKNQDISASVTGKSDIIAAAQNVLLDMHFAVEKADVQAGLVRTRPLPGAQFFEFWRSDNVGADNWAIANLQNIRRTAEINITEQNGQQHIDCVVSVQRLSLPGRGVDSAARAYEMFSASGPLLQTLRLGSSTTAGLSWVSLGRDGRLEAEILQRIDRRIAPHKTATKSSSEG